jgi:hypothetical protein
MVYDSFGSHFISLLMYAKDYVITDICQIYVQVTICELYQVELEYVCECVCVCVRERERL